jgi:hypothetical protein
MFPVALALLFLGAGPDSVAPLLTQLKDELPRPVARFAQVLLTAFASTGSGEAVKIQEMWLLLEQLKDEPVDGTPACPYLSPQPAAVLGLALMAMGEDIGSMTWSRSP